MATWKKSPAALITAFDSALAAEPQAERRQMFGYPCAFVNGHMAVGLHEDRLIARVPDEAERHPCVILGRRMKSYAAIPLDEALAPRTMPHWISRAVAYTATMAPKPKAAATARRAPTPTATAKPRSKSTRKSGSARSRSRSRSRSG